MIESGCTVVLEQFYCFTSSSLRLEKNAMIPYFAHIKFPPSIRYPTGYFPLSATSPGWRRTVCVPCWWICFSSPPPCPWWSSNVRPSPTRTPWAESQRWSRRTWGFRASRAAYSQRLQCRTFPNSLWIRLGCCLGLNFLCAQSSAGLAYWRSLLSCKFNRGCSDCNTRWILAWEQLRASSCCRTGQLTGDCLVSHHGRDVTVSQLAIEWPLTAVGTRCSAFAAWWQARAREAWHGIRKDSPHLFLVWMSPETWLR